MHELSITMSIIELAQEESDRRGIQVSAVHLKLGALSGVVKEALLGSFEMACEDTPLKRRRLLIEELPVSHILQNVRGAASHQLRPIILLCGVRYSIGRDCAGQGTRSGCTGRLKNGIAAPFNRGQEERSEAERSNRACSA